MLRVVLLLAIGIVITWLISGVSAGLRIALLGISLLRISLLLGLSRVT